MPVYTCIALKNDFFDCYRLTCVDTLWFYANKFDIQVKYGEIVWPLYVLSNVELAGSAHYAIYSGLY